MFLYKYLKNGEVIYVGKTKRDINIRIREHYNTKDLPTDAEIYVCKCDTEAYINVMEVLLIDKYRPIFNIDCNSLSSERANIPFEEPEFITLEEYNELNVPIEYKRDLFGKIKAVMTDGSERKPEYCQCLEGAIPEKIYNENGYIYSICFMCQKLIRNSFRDII